MVSSVKLPILKKGEYILWTIKMEQYLAHTDYALWEVILNGQEKENLRALCLWPFQMSILLDSMESKMLRPYGLLLKPDLVKAPATLMNLMLLIVFLLLQAIVLKHKVAMLSMRVERFYKKTRRKLEFNGKEPVGFDKTKVECFNCHRRGHFARDYRSARNVGYKGRDNEEKATDFALMAFTSNPLSSSSSNSKLDEALREKEELKAKLKKFETSSKNITKLLDSQISAKVKTSLGYDTQFNEKEVLVVKEEEVTETVFDKRSIDEENSLANDRFKKVEGYHAVPPPLTRNYMPPKSDLSFLRLDNSIYKFKISETVTSLTKDEKGAPKTSTACAENTKEDRMAEKSVLPNNMGKGTGHKKSRPVWNDVQRINHQNKFAPTTVFTRSRRIPVSATKPKVATSTSAAKLVNTAGPKQSVHFSKSRSTFHKSYSPIRRSFYDATAHSRRNSTERVNIVRSKAVSVVKGNRVSAVKTSTCCVWRPKVNDIDQIFKDNRHMTGNKAYLADYQEINDGGFVAFGSSREFKTKDLDEFCRMKGIKRKYSNARTLQQNRVAERKNMTLIEAARTMLANSLLPITIWVEAVNTVCYVLNKALVTKSHNKTPYELLNDRTPRLDFMRPFSCPVTILNTLDPLGKFEGKADEGFLVGYSITSKAFRVFNTKTKKFEENLHVRFLENKPNVARTGPNWLFDIDSLTNSMNYIPVSAGNQTDKNAGPQDTNGNAGIQDNVDARKEVSDQYYIVLPLWSSISFTFKSLDDKVVDDKPKDDAGSNTIEEPAGGLSSPYPDAFIPATTLLYIDKDDSQIPNLEDTAELRSIGIFTGAYVDDLGIFTCPVQSVGTEADFNNRDSSNVVSPIPTHKVHIDHPKDQILGDPKEGPIIKIMRTAYVPASFYRWNLKSLQKVWRLVDLPYRKKAIGTKWVYRNKKDERGIVVRNKPRLVAQGHRQEEGINYDKVYVDDIIFRSSKKSLCDEFEALMHERFQMSFIGEITFFLGLQFWNFATSQTINDEKQIHAIVDGGYTLGSNEGSMKLKELTDLCTTLLQKVLDLDNVKTTYAKEISSMKKRFTKLEQRQSSRFLGFHPFRAGTFKRHSLGRKKISKQERKNLKSQKMFQDIDDVLDVDVDTEMIVKDKGNGEKGGSTAETVSTARPDISAARQEVGTAEPKTPPTTATLFDDEDVTIADTLVKMKNQKAKEKGIAFKNVGFEEDKNRIRSIKKRASGLSSKHKLPKKQKVNDQESKDSDKEHRKCLKVVLNDDKAINYETLDVKSLIVDCESQVLGINKAEKRYPLTKEILEKMVSSRLESKTESTLALDLIKFIKLQIKEKLSVWIHPPGDHEAYTKES
uniref:Integrase catalytic domain-containing protein n=1 Tax=Tanacetum cinerariifolium TaxID=118510 RepID=A0A699GJC9_TANCI|nr:hypothetical protein [Tanacetum cinerariifolium]